jgi:hypothetical protein
MQKNDEEKPKNSQFLGINFNINVLQMFNFFNMLFGILILLLMVVNHLSYYLVKILPS